MQNTITDRIEDLDLSLSFSGAALSAATSRVTLPNNVNIEALVIRVDYSMPVSGTTPAAVINDCISECFTTSNFDNATLFRVSAGELSELCQVNAILRRAGTVEELTVVDDAGAAVTGTATFILFQPIDRRDAATFEMTFDSSLNTGTVNAAWSVTVNLGAIVGNGGRVISDRFTKSATTSNQVDLPGWPVQAALITGATANDLTRIEFPAYTVNNPQLLQGQWEAYTDANLAGTSTSYWMIANQPAAPGLQLRVDGTESEARTFTLVSPRTQLTTARPQSGGVSGPSRPVPSGIRPTGGSSLRNLTIVGRR